MERKPQMIGLDTNVLVRILVDDDLDQNRSARALLDVQDLNRRYFIGAVVLAEATWILRKKLGYTEQTIRKLIQTMLEMSQLVIEYEADLWPWVATAGSSKVQLSDYLISWSHRDLGCSQTFTFDKKAAAHISGMELLQ
jgi:predicted nucleic-acid-binding protein